MLKEGVDPEKLPIAFFLCEIYGVVTCTLGQYDGILVLVNKFVTVNIKAYCCFFILFTKKIHFLFKFEWYSSLTNRTCVI